MSLLEIIFLTCLSIGAAAILRFIWLDTVAFADQAASSVSDPSVVSRRTAHRLALEAEAARARAEDDSLPWAA